MSGITTPTTTTRGKFNPVTRPSHYNRKGIEAIDAIEAAMSEEQFIGVLKGNVLKYVWRFEYKNGTEDLKKAQWYLDKLVVKYEERQTRDKASKRQKSNTIKRKTRNSK